MGVSVEPPPALPIPEEPGPEALIEEARRRARRRRRTNTVTLAAGVLLVTGLILLVLSGVGGHSNVGRAGRAHGAIAPGGPWAGRYWYTRTIVTDRLSRPAGGEYQAKVFMRARGPMVAFDVRVSTETWVGLDGTTRTRVLVLSQRFASPIGKRRWAAYHRPLPAFAQNLDGDSVTQGAGRFPVTGPSGDPLGPQDIGDGAFTLGQLVALPQTPSVLLRRIEAAFAALGRRQSNTALDRCGWGGIVGCPRQPEVPAWQRGATRASADLANLAQMLAWPIPHQLRRALLGAATTLPQISSAVSVHRITGGTTVVTVAPRRYPGRFVPTPMRLSFVSSSGRLLEQPAGRVAVAGPAGSVWALPPGVSPLNPVHQPPSPPVVSVTPAVGRPGTVFRVTISSRPGMSAPSSVGGRVSGPVYPGCRSGFPSPTPPTPAPWLTSRHAVTSGARTLYTYRISPPAGTHHAWCSGRYQLAVTRSGLGGAGASDLGGTAVLFQVR